MAPELEAMYGQVGSQYVLETTTKYTFPVSGVILELLGIILRKRGGRLRNMGLAFRD